MKKLFFALTTLIALSSLAHATDHEEELNPFAADIEQQLLENDFAFGAYRVEAPESDLMESFMACHRETCPVYIEISVSTQRAIMKENGQLVVGHDGKTEWLATTGAAGYETPHFDRAFGTPLRAYTKYSSTKFPGGDWNGLGNMPYAVFIRPDKGFAIHGTTPGNILKLGKPRVNGHGSHGCIRLHPLNAKVFNAAVKKYGAAQSWVRVIP